MACRAEQIELNCGRSCNRNSYLRVVVLAVVLPFTPLGAWFGFVPPSAAFLSAIAGLTVSYLLLAQGAKWAFYSLWPPAGAALAPTIRAQLPLIERS